jgi:hypothetical protein
MLATNKAAGSRRSEMNRLAEGSPSSKDWLSRRRTRLVQQSRAVVATVDRALARHGKPEIFNTDQVAAYQSTSAIAEIEITIRMDGRVCGGITNRAHALARP